MLSVRCPAAVAAIARLPIAAVLVVLVGCGGQTGQQSATPLAFGVASPTVDPEFDIPQMYQQAQASFDAGDYHRAVADFTRILLYRSRVGSAVTEDVSREDVLYQRGVAYLEMGFPDTAIEDLTDVLQSRPNAAHAYARRGQAQLQMHDLFEAISDCTASIRLNAENPAAYRTRGMAYFRRGRHERAVADLEQARRQSNAPDDEAVRYLQDAYIRWSEKLAQAGREAEAQQLLAKANEFQLGPDADSPPVDAALPSESENFVPRPGLDTPRGLRAKPVLSAEESRALEIDEHSRAAEDLLGQSDSGGALQELTKAIAIDPSQPSGYVERAALWLQLGFADNALLDVDDALRLERGSAENYRLKAEILLALDDGLAATAAASEAIRLDPGEGRNFAVRGTAYLRRHMFDEAIRDLRYSAEIDASLKDKLKPTLAEAYYRRGESREQAGQMQQAQSDYSQAAKLGWIAESTVTP